MGSCSIEFEIDKQASKDEINKAFIAQRKDDRFNNGSREGYSGDFQTVSSIKYTDKVFATYEDAYSFCLDNSKKWDYAVSAYYYSYNLKNDKKYKELKTKIEKLSMQQDISELKQKMFSDLKNATSPRKTCKNCASSIKRSYLKNSDCPVCKQSLFSETNKKRIIKAQDNNKNKLDKAKIALKTYLKKKSDITNIKTVVAGWGAC